MATSPITSWQKGGETVTDFISFSSKITAGGDSSHEIKGHLLLGRKIMNNLWVYMCPPILKPPPTYLPTVSLQVVPEH